MTAITVVVPTYNRAHDLDRCLEALKRQTLGAHLFEVVVVDDGSPDSTPAVLASWAVRWPALRYLRQANSGPATARNAGIARAASNIIAFTDDDCEPAADWLQRIHGRFSAGLHGCLHGVVRSSQPSSTFVHSVIANGAVITSNLAVETRVFEKIGVFDSVFRAPWCEDADLFYRMTKAGIAITYDEHLIVDHPPRYQPFWSTLRKSRFFQYYGLIARKHPDMESLSEHRDRLILAAKKLVMMGLFAAAVARVASIPWLAACLVSPFIFCLVDGYRLQRIKRQLASSGMHVLARDQVLFVLFNWTTNLLESYYLLKGALRYR